ncbi:MAG: peptidoglycan-associated lipoprotein Pal [Gammaproteobacteria bacterium]|nr:peptidoglycan-associated lipoprotein Pal [Gammaproteobacteria bacterium]
MRRYRRTTGRAALGAAIAGLILAGCEGTLPEKETMASVEDRSAGNAGTSGSTQALPGARAGFSGHPLDDPNSQLFTKVIYFAFDSATVASEDRPTVEAHAEYLAANPNAVVILEGHADERGSREYNIALGEGRSKSVHNLMSLLGASQSQVRTVSYGEERPQDLAHTEQAWSANRRVEFNYISR